jgi:hypothetical protein
VQANEFTLRDSEFMSAHDKRLALRAWETFLAHGCQFKHFTKRLYEHLIQHCSFIAHYNRLGFYDHYFRAPETIQHFLDQFDESKGCRSIEIGMDLWVRDPDYRDINAAMCRIAGVHMTHLRADADQAEFDRDRTELLRLGKKLGAQIALPGD